MTPLANLNAASEAEFLDKLEGIYEYSRWVAIAVLPFRPFESLNSLQLVMKQAVENADAAAKLSLIRAHPDLAGKLARAGALTAESTREQAGLGLDRLTAEEFQIFSSQNNRYRETFGFPFIICARQTTKQGVRDAFEERLQNDRDHEILEALRQIHQIARLRLEDAFC